MAAPTPVSAYLHSATMVKLGIFLLARLYPLLAGVDAWATLLVPVGFTTMLVAALFALLSHELKAILAWSTVSALGFLTGYYGQGAAAGVPYDLLHIVNHVFYKGCLFMMVGVVAHATGIRDIRELGGLFRRMPLTGVTALVACAAMAGLPGTVGFLSKELALKECFSAVTTASFGRYAAACLIAASVMKVAFSLRLFCAIFLGREPEGVGAHFHVPSLALQFPPLILAGATLVFGLFPSGLEHALSAFATRGLHTGMEHLAIWHGFTLEFKASLGIVAAGVALFLVLRPHAGRLAIPTVLRLDLGFEAGMRGLDRFARVFTRAVRTDRPVDFLVIVIGFTVLLVGGTLLREVFGAGGPGLAVFVAVLITFAVIGAVVLRRWTTRLICLSVAGFLVCFCFVLYQAPDLALTQILVEVITLFLVLILLGRFPAAAEEGESQSRGSPATRGLHLLIALGVGVTMSLFLLLVTASPAASRLGDLFVSASVPLAKGTNAVNTTLIDFRGFDTMGEITVLVVATLGCLGLIMRYKRSEEEFKAGPMDAPGFGSFKDREDDRAGP
jgi:multisubunit Na+/H+ antiporter MnhB subunit